MARTDNYDPVTNETDVYYQYQADAILQESVTILPVPGSSNITTIIGDGGGSVTGPTATIGGGVTGYDFVASGTTIALTVANAATIRSSLGLGTLAVVNSPVPIANGGTAGTTAATARTNLEVSRFHSAAVAPAVTDDGTSGYPVGSLWLDTVLQDGYMSTNASAGAAVWKKITP